MDPRDNGLDQRFEQARRATPRRTDGPLTGCLFLLPILGLELLVAVGIGWFWGSWQLGLGAFVGLFLISLVISIKL